MEIRSVPQRSPSPKQNLWGFLKQDLYRPDDLLSPNQQCHRLMRYRQVEEEYRYHSTVLRCCTIREVYGKRRARCCRVQTLLPVNVAVSSLELGSTLKSVCYSATIVRHVLNANLRLFIFTLRLCFCFCPFIC